MKKRILIALLALIMLLPFATACQKKESGKNNEVTTVPTQQNETKGYKKLLTEEDFNNADFNVLIMPDRKSWSFCEDEPEDQFAYAIFCRNSYVDEYYDVNLHFTVGEQSSGYFSTACQKCLMSDTADYDLISPDYYYGIVENGFFIDLAARKEIRLENPYWVSGWNDSVTVNGKDYAAVGFFTLDPVAKVEALYSNDTMAKALGIDSIYDTVKKGDWTLELMKTYVTMAAAENGDSTWDYEDTYGLCANLWSGRAIMTSADYKLSEFKDGKVSFTLATERNGGIFEKIYQLFNETDGVYYCGGVSGSSGFIADGKRDTDLFLSGRSLFLAHSFAELSKIGPTFTQEYSVFPMPKYDETQKDYVSTVLGSTIFGVMRNAKNIHMSCTILEALNILSYEDVLPVYYDKLLRGRYTQNPQSAEMLDLIRNSIYVDFLFINSAAFDIDGLPSVANNAFDMIAKKDKTFASTMAKYDTGLSKAWRNFVEFYD